MSPRNYWDVATVEWRNGPQGLRDDDDDASDDDDDKSSENSHTDAVSRLRNKLPLHLRDSKLSLLKFRRLLVTALHRLLLSLNLYNSRLSKTVSLKE